MYGAIIGDIVGSKYEFNSIKTKDFPFVSEGCEFTDDTVMTVAVARALLRSYSYKDPFKEALVEEMQELGRRFPNAGYGARFDAWLYQDHPEPYNSYGNGSAMRVSPCGLMAVKLDEALALAKASAEVTHAHPEGIKGAQATAAAVFLAKEGQTKEEIADYLRANFYPLDRSLDEIREGYSFDVTCQGSVPEAITAFLESESYEDAVRNAVSLGGDSDTQAAIAGGIAWTYYRLWDHTGGSRSPLNEDDLRDWCKDIVDGYGIAAMLPDDFIRTIDELSWAWVYRSRAFDRIGLVNGIPL